MNGHLPKQEKSNSHQNTPAKSLNASESIDWQPNPELTPDRVSSLKPDNILQLQRTIGNQAVMRLINPKTVRPQIQRMVSVIEADEITQPMRTRWNETANRFKDQIVAQSPLAQGNINQVVLFGVSQKSHGMRNYASTTLYVGKDGYQGDDYNHFVEIWGDPQIDVPKNVAVRIVIAVNLTMNSNPAEVYATLLHEWIAHATKWEGLLTLIRAGTAKEQLALIKKTGVDPRAQTEHQQYANISDEQIDGYVRNLNLGQELHAKVVEKFKDDRNRYDKRTGAMI